MNINLRCIQFLLTSKFFSGLGAHKSIWLVLRNVNTHECITKMAAGRVWYVFIYFTLNGDFHNARRALNYYFSQAWCDIHQDSLSFERNMWQWCHKCGKIYISWVQLFKVGWLSIMCQWTERALTLHQSVWQLDWASGAIYYGGLLLKCLHVQVDYVENWLKF